MLKSLELFGFKSFADRTRFDFDPGVTGVVGPNGSGKSNVVDAVKWILGVQSAKSLRGKSMTDVIFNGSSGRKAANLAEATLAFDNRRRFLDLDADDVRIGRRLLRNGDSEYLVNDQTARLKDVVKLFMGTGAGASAYSIIEQGRVDQILQANAASRRKVFEEAAGISRYKSDRAEAERKLERVEQNLLRLRDIVDTAETQLDSLRSQAAKATKFREISAELEEAWLGLASDEYRIFTEELSESQSAIAELDARLAALEEQRQGVEERLSVVDRDVGRVDDRLRTAEREASSVREAVAARTTTARHEANRLEDLHGDRRRTLRQRAVLESRSTEILAEHARIERQRRDFEDEVERHRVEFASENDENAALADRIAEARRGVETDRARLLEAVRETTRVQNDLDAATSQAVTLRDRLESSAPRLEEAAERIAEAERHCDEQETGVAAAEEEVTAREREHDAARDRRRELVGQLDDHQRRVAEHRETRSGWEARRLVLEDLETRQEGFGIGVREILARSKTIVEPPWKNVLGTVADLVEVDLEHAATIEVALGSRAHLVVVDEMQPMIEYLVRSSVSIASRVGFVQYAEEEETPTPDLSGERGIVARADSFVRGTERLPAIGRQLLANTWIVETLEAALRLSESIGKGCRFVTPQGELVEPDGTIHAGAIGGETAVVSRKSELRRLKNELARIEKRIESEQSRASGLGEELVAAEQAWDDAKTAVRKAVEGLSEARARAAAARSERDLRQREHDALRAERESDEQRLAERESQAERLRGTLAESEALVASLETSIADGDREAAELDERMRDIRRQRDEKRLELAKQEERLEALQDTARRLEHELSQRRDQIEEAERRLEDVSAKHREAVLHLLNCRAERDELLLEDEAVSDRVRELVAEKDRIRATRSELLAEEARLRDARREAESERHDVELRTRETRHHLDALTARIDEEFGVALADVVAEGRSAFEAYLAERGTTETLPGDEAEAETIAFADVREELQARVDRLRKRLKSLGQVNADGLRDLDELESRFGRLAAQLEDLEHARDELRDLVRRINVECRTLFTESFETIRGYFRDLFRKLFGGGEGDIVLEDPEDVLECGIDIVARPPGKELRSLSLLSGGEKTMTAVALVMAIFKSKPSPFCILDEVDAALDEANVERYNAVVREFAESTQFVIITHRKPTMTICDTLYGVTMEQSGVSKRMTVRFEDVTETGEIRRSADEPHDRAA